MHIHCLNSAPAVLRAVDRQKANGALEDCPTIAGKDANFALRSTLYIQQGVESVGSFAHTINSSKQTVNLVMFVTEYI